MLKICEKNSSVNVRFEIFVMAFRVRKLFGTFEKRAPGDIVPLSLIFFLVEFFVFLFSHLHYKLQGPWEERVFAKLNDP